MLDRLEWRRTVQPKTLCLSTELHKNGGIGRQEIQGGYQEGQQEQKEKDRD